MSENLFLETTIQVEKIFAEKDKREVLLSFLSKSKKKCTSNYVLDQFKATFVNASVLFHRLLIDSPDVHTALKRAEIYTEGRLKKMLSIFYALCDEVGYNKQDVIDRLEIYIEGGLIDEFLSGVDDFVDETKCCRVRNEPFKKGRGYEMSVSCNKQNPPGCSINEFWKKNKSLLAKIANSLNTDSDKTELEKVKEVARKVYDTADLPFGNNCSVHLSDTIIAIEAPASSKIFTTNEKHFAPICAAIDKKHLKWPK